MKKKPLKNLPQRTLTKLTGFDLLIGQAYQQGFYRSAEPYPAVCTNPCPQCVASILMKWPLHRQIQAFGNQITQTKIIYECLTCHHEFEDDAEGSNIKDNPILNHPPKPKLKLTKFQLTALLILAKEKGFL